MLGRKTDAIKGVVPCAHPGRVLHGLAAPVTMPLTGAVEYFTRGAHEHVDIKATPYGFTV